MTRRSRGLLTYGNIASLSVALALIAAACGSSQPTPVAANVKLASTPTSLSDAWPLADHVITPAALPGFVRSWPPRTSSVPDQLDIFVQTGSGKVGRSGFRFELIACKDMASTRGAPLPLR